MNEIVETFDPEKDRERILKKFKELYKNISQDSPDPKAVEELKQFIQENPAIFWETYSLSNDVIENLLSHPETNAKFKMTVKETLKEIRKQLNYANSTIIEKMVIDSMIVSWVRLQYLELAFTNTLVNKKYSIQNRKHFDQLITSAQRRTLRAMDALARIRKSGGNLIINIERKEGKRHLPEGKATFKGNDG